MLTCYTAIPVGFLMTQTRPRSVRIPGMVKAWKVGIKKNPRFHQKKLTQRTSVSKSFIMRAKRNDLRVKAMQGDTFNVITNKQKKNMVN